jgi:hypothetical protein
MSVHESEQRRNFLDRCPEILVRYTHKISNLSSGEASGSYFMAVSLACTDGMEHQYHLVTQLVLFARAPMDRPKELLRQMRTSFLGAVVSRLLASVLAFLTPTINRCYAGYRPDPCT